MALITSAASGNFSAGATWTGGVVPTVGDEARASTGHTVTIDVNTTCDEISNAGTGKFVINDGVTLTANVTSKSTTASSNCLEFNSSSPAVCYVVGNCTGGASASVRAVTNTSTGTINITGNIATLGTGGGVGNPSAGVRNQSTGTVNITGNCTGKTDGTTAGMSACFNASTGTINITGNCTGGAGTDCYGAFQNSTGTLSIIGTVTASQTAAGVAGTNVQQVTILSGPFVTETTRGVNPIACTAWRWNASPSNSTYLEVMTNDLLTKRNLVTADNITGMPAASDVKSGIAYGPSSELTGTFSQTVTPSVSDIATAVWGAATRTITGGTVDTLTNAPASVTPADIWDYNDRTLTSASGPTAVEIRQEIDANSTKLDVAVGTRLADADYVEPANSDITAIKAKTDALNTERLANVATTAIVGNLLAQANS
jgi:hypothetical protein